MAQTFLVPADFSANVNPFSQTVIAINPDGTAIGASSGGGGTTTVTPNFVSVGASGSGTIPAGAKGWTFTVLSGTATLGGVAVSVGFSDSDTNTLAAAISYSTGVTSSAYVRYNT